MLETYVDLLIKRNRMVFWRAANIALACINLVACAIAHTVPWSAGICLLFAVLITYLVLPAMDGQIESVRGKMKSEV